MCVFYRAAIAAILFLTGSAAVNAAEPLTLAEAESLALEAEPGIAMLQANAAALRERAVVAGELPDPVMRIGLNNFPLESGGFSTEGMTQAAVGFRQMFPAGAKRELGALALRQTASAREEQGAARRREVLTATRHAWLDVYRQQHSLDLLRESRPFFAELVEISRSLYEVGRKGQQDVLRAQLELSRLDDRLIDNERRLARARAVLGEWIGIESQRPVANVLPEWRSIPVLEDIENGLREHPLLRAADADIDARNTGVDLAGQRSKPGWSLDVGYGYREGNLPNGQPRSDMITVGISVDLPFFRRDSIDSTLAAALQERSAANAQRRQLHRTLTSRVEAEHAHFTQLSRRMELYEQQILSQASDHAAASLLAYQNDQADFANVMRAYIDDLDTRTRYIHLQVDRAASYAVLANLGGFPK
ncbi:MAG: TolC family protein [Woeseiaceae bacterium]|nr:TolC family protein [Woeseiaceae bacterium]